MRDWGGASSLRPSGSLTQTQFHNHTSLTINCKTFIFSSSVLLLCVHTQYNPFAHPSHPSCSYNYLLSPIILFLHILFVLHFFYSIAHLTLYFSFLPIYIYIYIYICSCVVLLLFNLYSFALSTERTWLDLHFTSDYTLYNLLCDK